MSRSRLSLAGMRMAYSRGGPRDPAAVVAAGIHYSRRLSWAIHFGPLKMGGLPRSGTTTIHFLREISHATARTRCIGKTKIRFRKKKRQTGHTLGLIPCRIEGQAGITELCVARNDWVVC